MGMGRNGRTNYFHFRFLPRLYKAFDALLRIQQLRRSFSMTTLLHVSLHIVLGLLTVVAPDEVYVRVGDLVVLHCPNIRMSNTKTPPSWTSFTPHERNLANEMNSTSPFLIHERSLVLLSASIDHQGNYSCSMGNHTFWSKLVVYSAVPNVTQKMARYTTTCYTQERCSLRCPISNSPGSIIPNMTRLGITWEKDGTSQFRETLSFRSVEEKDQGTFTCTRSYRYKDQIYNRTSTIALTVKPQEPLPNIEIISPHDGDVFEVDLGSVFVVNCTATIFPDFDEVYWIIDKSSVKTDSNLRVFSNFTMFTSNKKSHMTGLLIFKKVLKEDLSKDFTCKLESVAAPSSLVTVSLKQKRQKNPVFPIVIIVGVILGTALICAKFKMNIILCLRDRHCFHAKSVDAKPHDASLMCYKDESELALSEDDIKWLENVLVKDLGYKLCLHRNNSSGEEKPVLDSIEKSLAVILVPVVSNPGPDCSLVTKDCSLMDNSSTRFILIQTDTEKESKSSPKLKLHEAASLMGHLDQRIITWKGTHSKRQSSSFIKHLRYHLPPPQHNKQEQHITEV
uniref:Ig-like domain-containing protein n=1 Tax=Neogobius melanostomus TaxID=47308 RepID=A0A8C6TEQ7_9GOBI